MTSVRIALRRVAALLKWRRLEDELDSEVEAHLEFAAADYVSRGMPAEAARVAALRDFGGVARTKEVYRDGRGLPWLETLLRDFRDARRSLLRTPSTTIVIVLTLGFGIGATTAIFSLIDAVVLRSLPLRAPEQLVEPLTIFPGEPRLNLYLWKHYEHFRDQNHVFADLMAVSSARWQVSGQGFDAEAVTGQYASGNFFTGLGVQPALGRLFGPDDDRTTTPAAVVVLSWPYWNRRFQRDPSVVGAQLVLDRLPVTVIGVSAPSFSGVQTGMSIDMLAPVSLETVIQRPSRRADGTLAMNLIARLAPDASIAKALSEMQLLDRLHVEDMAARVKIPQWRQATIALEPAAAGLSSLRDQFSRSLMTLMILVGLLLLIACTNIASILLARAAGRQREMAVRTALGASRVRLIRQVLTESVLLSMLGGLLGVGLSSLGVTALLKVMASGRPMIGWPATPDIQVRVDARILLFTSVVSIGTGVFFGLAPTWTAMLSAPASSLRSVGADLVTRSQQLFGKTLVVAQVTVSILLLSAAAVGVREVSRLRNVDVGFTRDSVLLVSMNPQGSGHNRTQLTRLYQEFLRRIEAIPAVRSVALSAVTPIQGGAASRFASVEGLEERVEDRRRVMMNWVGPKYFETLRTPILAGRDFQFEDEGRAPVAIVNQSMARHYFGATTAIGKHVAFENDTATYEIIGVVGDAKYVDLHDVPPRTAYLNAFQQGQIGSAFSIRTAGRPEAIASDVRRIAGEVIPRVRIANVTTLADQVDGSIVPERMIALLSAFFSGLGALLAALGLYGLLSYSIVRRRNEIGIRVALGAGTGRVVGAVIKDAMVLVGAGLLLGGLLVAWIRQLVPYWASDSVVPTVLFAGAIMLGVALVAALLPALHATRIQPTEALRQS